MGCFESKPEYEPPRETRASAAAGGVQQQRTTAAPKSVQLTSQTPISPIPRAKVEITDADRAKHKLKHTRDVLDRTIMQSERVLLRDLDLAKSLHMEGKKESALVLLRRRKLIEKKISHTKASLEKIESSLSTLEGAENINTILAAIEQSTQVVDKLNSLVSVERAERIMQDSRDSVAYTAEVAAVLVQDNQLQAVAEENEEDIMQQIREFENETGGDIVDEEEETLTPAHENENEKESQPKQDEKEEEAEELVGEKNNMSDEPLEKVEDATIAAAMAADEMAAAHPTKEMMDEEEEVEESEEVVVVKKKKKKASRTAALA